MPVNLWLAVSQVLIKVYSKEDVHAGDVGAKKDSTKGRRDALGHNLGIIKGENEREGGGNDTADLTYTELEFQ
jgi:hypothetical protein